MLWMQDEPPQTRATRNRSGDVANRRGHRFDPARRAVFEARRDAVEWYLRGQSLTTIEEATGINRRRLYRSLQHALAPHCDGRLFGYRVLMKNARTSEYTRVKAMRIHGERGSCGASGALPQLFERYPSLVQ